MKLFYLFLSALILYVAGGAYFSQRGPDVFAADRLLQNYRDPFEVAEENETAQNILGTAPLLLNYIGHGSQAAAFATPDGKYVVKFILFQKMAGEKKGHFFSPMRLFSSYRKKRDEEIFRRRTAKVGIPIRAYAFALEKLKEETGMIAFHLHPTKNLFPPCVVVDKFGKQHSVDLDRTVFLLQERAIPIDEHFAHINSREHYEQSIAAIEHLFEQRARKGLTDRRIGFKSVNYGFIGPRAIMLDPGRVYFLPKVADNPEVEIETKKGHLKSWLANWFPEDKVCPQSL